MTKKEKFYNSKLIPSAFLLLTTISAILFRACKSNWVFINNTLGIDFFSVALLGLMSLACIVFAVLLKVRENQNSTKSKAYRIAYTATLILSIVIIIFSFAYAAGLALSESSEVFILTLTQTLKEGALLILVPFLALFYPKLSCKTKKITALLLIAITFIIGLNSFYPIMPYKITSDPMVIDNGKEYSIVFSTNDEGTALVEYSYEGKIYKIYDHEGGRLNADKKIHSISVPYEHLRNNTYKVSSTRVIEEFSYGSRRGKTVISEEYAFKYNDGDNQTWLVISDWHTMLDTAYKAIENLESDYDAVILLGDASPGVDFEQQVVTNTVQFGGEVSKGTKPVLYVRGNHETRGAYAKNLPSALGLDQFYYTADIGPYSFVVLDSGEDKDDSHSEYGGMTDYNTYRFNMIEWLKEVETKNEKVIALSHSWKISDVEPELSAEGWKELDRIGARLLLSGHEHRCHFITDEKCSDITTYVDGGKSNDNYVASLLTMDKNGFNIKAVDNNGNNILSESFSW